VQALYHLTARSTRRAGGRQRRLGERRHRHHRHPRLRPDPAQDRRRYAWPSRTSRELFKRERPGGRSSCSTAIPTATSPWCSRSSAASRSRGRGARTLGYSEARDTDEADFDPLCALLDAVRISIEVFAGFCYTQFADTYQEANGLLYADRTPKFPLEEIAAATRGPVHRWRSRRTERDRAP
jgi:hypothetical protein